MEALIESFPVLPATEALSIIKQCSSTVTQFGCNARVWQVSYSIKSFLIGFFTSLNCLRSNELYSREKMALCTRGRISRHTECRKSLSSFLWFEYDQSSCVGEAVATLPLPLIIRHPYTTNIPRRVAWPRKMTLPLPDTCLVNKPPDVQAPPDMMIFLQFFSRTMNIYMLNIKNVAATCKNFSVNTGHELNVNRGIYSIYIFTGKWYVYYIQDPCRYCELNVKRP